MEQLDEVCISAFFDSELLEICDDVDMYELCKNVENCELNNTFYDEELYNICAGVEKRLNQPPQTQQIGGALKRSLNTEETTNVIAKRPRIEEGTSTSSSRPHADSEKDVENLRDEFNAIFEDDETEKPSKSLVPLEKYEALKTENDTLLYELEGYKNEAHLAKDEAERKFEKFKAHFIAQQALQNKQPGHHVYPPLPPPPTLPALPDTPAPTPKPQPPPPTPDDMETLLHPSVAPSEAKLISVLTAFLLAHPLGASLDYLVSYVKSMIPKATQAAVHNVLEKYKDVFSRTTTGVGANIEHRWTYIIFEGIKKGK